MCEKLNKKLKDKPFQEKMKAHCDVVYEETVKQFWWFGIAKKLRKPASNVALVSTH